MAHLVMQILITISALHKFLTRNLGKGTGPDGTLHFGNVLMDRRSRAFVTHASKFSAPTFKNMSTSTL